MPSRTEIESTLASNTGKGWRRFVEPHTDLIPGSPIIYGVRKARGDGTLPSVDSHDVLKDGTAKTFLSLATPELPYFAGVDSADPDSILRRAGRTLIGAVNNRLRSEGTGEQVGPQSDEYKGRRDVLVAHLSGRAFTLVSETGLYVPETVKADEDDMAYLLDFLRGNRKLDSDDFEQTAGALVRAYALNTKAALEEIAEAKEREA